MTFHAAYYGPCAYGDQIEPGDPVEYNRDQKLVHLSCRAREQANTAPATRICPDCNLDHAGACF